MTKDKLKSGKRKGKTSRKKKNKSESKDEKTPEWTENDSIWQFHKVKCPQCDKHMSSGSEMRYDKRTQQIMFKETVKCTFCGHYLFERDRKGSKIELPTADPQTKLSDF
jgi:hypothetical protein